MMECGLLAPPVPESATPQMDPARNLGAVERIQRVRTSSITSASSRNFYPDECIEKELHFVIQYFIGNFNLSPREYVQYVYLVI